MFQKHANNPNKNVFLFTLLHLIISKMWQWQTCIQTDIQAFGSRSYVLPISSTLASIPFVREERTITLLGDWLLFRKLRLKCMLISFCLCPRTKWKKNILNTLQQCNVKATCGTRRVWLRVLRHVKILATSQIRHVMQYLVLKDARVPLDTYSQVSHVELLTHTLIVVRNCSIIIVLTYVDSCLKCLHFKLGIVGSSHRHLIQIHYTLLYSLYTI